MRKFWKDLILDFFGFILGAFLTLFLSLGVAFFFLIALLRGFREP